MVVDATSPVNQTASEPPDLDAAYDVNLDEVGRLRGAIHKATIAQDAPSLERLTDELQAALAKRAHLERLLVDRFLRGLRLAMRICPHNVITHLRDIDPDIARRLVALEVAAAETAIALEDLGVTA